MKPGLVILPTIWRGCDWLPVIFKWKDPDGNPFDLTDWSPFVETRSGFSLQPVITDVAGGIVQLALNPTQSALMKLGVEQWDWVWAYKFNTVDQIKYPPIVAGTVCVDEPTTHDFPTIT